MHAPANGGFGFGLDRFSKREMQLRHAPFNLRIRFFHVEQDMGGKATGRGVSKGYPWFTLPLLLQTTRMRVSSTFTNISKGKG